MNMQSPYCLPLPSNLSHRQHYYQSLLHISRESRQQRDACISTYRHTPRAHCLFLAFSYDHTGRARSASTHTEGLP